MLPIEFQRRSDMFFPPENSLIRVSIALESTRRTKTRHGPGSTQHSCRPGRPKTPLNTQRGTVSAVSDPCLVACPHLPRTTALLPDEQPHLNLFPRPLVSAGLPGAPQQRHRDMCPSYVPKPRTTFFSVYCHSWRCYTVPELPAGVHVPTSPHRRRSSHCRRSLGAPYDLTAEDIRREKKCAAV